MDQIYIQPLTLVGGPQQVDGDAVRLVGGLSYAHQFALITRRDGVVVARETITARGMGDALARLPSDLEAEAHTQWEALRRPHPPLQCGERIIRLDQPQVMGILNVTPDSFSDGGRFFGDDSAAGNHAAEMLEDGAAIIDIGGESTRPGAAPVWEGDELQRVIPAVERCVAMGAAVSVDTRRASVMEAAAKAGAHIINDVASLRHEPRSVEVAAASALPVVLMHAPREGDNLHAREGRASSPLDVFDWLRVARDEAVAGGVASERIILDPGIGFGKSLAENLALLNALELFHALGHPILLGVSRKRMIGALSKEAPADRRLGGSLAIALRGFEAGCQILRVHDVYDTVQARNVWRGMRDNALTDFTDLPA